MTTSSHPPPRSPFVSGIEAREAEPPSRMDPRAAAARRVRAIRRVGDVLLRLVHGLWLLAKLRQELLAEAMPANAAARMARAREVVVSHLADLAFHAPELELEDRLGRAAALIGAGLETDLECKMFALSFQALLEESLWGSADVGRPS